MLHDWALQGLGLTWRSMWEVKDDIGEGRLVTVLDKFTYAGNIENLRPVLDDSRLSVVEGDILDLRHPQVSVQGTGKAERRLAGIADTQFKVDAIVFQHQRQFEAKGVRPQGARGLVILDRQR